MSNEITLNDIILWKANPLINPLTKRKIKENGSIYKKYRKLSNRSEEIEKDKYYDMRKNMIDPILLVQLPLYEKKVKDLFIFKYKWNPFNGNKTTIDPNGPLYFDPNTLIHYFYINRLQNLWIDGSNNNGEFFEGHYGDAVGNGPDFEIKGRGKHIDWYLFRLPIIDCYIGDIQTQAVTMGPILTDEDIQELYKLSKRYNYTEMYGYKRPNIIKMKKMYDIAIYNNKEYELNCLSNDEIKLIKYQINIDSVEKLKNFK